MADLTDQEEAFAEGVFGVMRDAIEKGDNAEHAQKLAVRVHEVFADGPHGRGYEKAACLEAIAYLLTIMAIDDRDHDDPANADMAMSSVLYLTQRVAELIYGAAEGATEERAAMDEADGATHH